MSLPTPTNRYFTIAFINYLRYTELKAMAGKRKRLRLFRETHHPSPEWLGAGNKWDEQDIGVKLISGDVSVLFQKSAEISVYCGRKCDSAKPKEYDTGFCGAFLLRKRRSARFFTSTAKACAFFNRARRTAFLRSSLRHERQFFFRYPGAD